MPSARTASSTPEGLQVAAREDRGRAVGVRRAARDRAADRPRCGSRRTGSSRGGSVSPAATIAERNPSMRACEHIMSSGPVIAAMRSWPRSIRCRVAIRPPDQFADPTDGTSGEGSPAGSMMTNGMARDRSIARYSGGRSEKTSTTPTGRRRSTPSTQSGRGRVPAAALGEHHAHPVLGGDVLDAADDLHRPGGLQLVEDQFDEAGGLLVAGAASQVAVLGEHRLDAAAGRGRDVGAAVQHLRDRRQRDAGLVGDLGEGRTSMCSGAGISGHVAKLSDAVGPCRAAAPGWPRSHRFICCY